MNLELFYRQDCPFSAKVRKFIRKERLDSKIEFHEVDEDESSLKELMAMNADDQVPCLLIDGKPMLESDDIIRWLDKNKSQIQ